MNQAGLPRPDKVMLVSAVKGSGVRELIEEVKAGLGFRWVYWTVCGNRMRINDKAANGMERRCHAFPPVGAPCLSNLMAVGLLAGVISGW